MKPLNIITGAGLLAILCLAGCTSDQLKRNTIEQGKTLTDLEYEMVLDNVAMFIWAPDSLPWHVNIIKGAITVSDNINPSFSYKSPPLTRTLGLGPSRFWQGDWTISPVMDTKVLKNLQGIYQEAARAGWVRRGLSPSGLGYSHGHYGGTFVWVEKADADKLAALTMSIFKAVNATKNSTVQVVINQRGHVQFADELKSQRTATSKYIYSQLPVGMKELLSEYDPKTSPTGLPGVLEFSLNQMVKSWTLNDASNLLVSLEISKVDIPKEATDRLDSKPQGNDLADAINNLFLLSYPNTLKPNSVINDSGNLLQPGFFLPPGPTQTIRR